MQKISSPEQIAFIQSIMLAAGHLINKYIMQINKGSCSGNAAIALETAARSTITTGSKKTTRQYIAIKRSCG